MFCPNCGQQIPDNTRFCHNCGKGIRPIQTQAPTMPPPDTTPYAMPVQPSPSQQQIQQQPVSPAQPIVKKRKAWYKRWWIWVIAGFLTLAVINNIGKSLNTEDAKVTTTINSGTNTTTNQKPTAAQPTGSPATEAPPTEDPEQLKEDYINSCQTIDYKTLARNPDSYKGEHFKFTGQVIQVSDNDSWFDNSTTLRINVTEEKYEYIDESFWSDTIICTINIPEGADRILEDDIIDIYGECYGLYTYTSVLKQKISIPRIDIKYYAIH